MLHGTWFLFEQTASYQTIGLSDLFIFMVAEGRDKYEWLIIEKMLNDIYICFQCLNLYARNVFYIILYRILILPPDIN